MKILTQIYKSPRRDETYLYVDKQRGLSVVPEALLNTFGTPQEVMLLMLTPDKKLARVQAADVCRQLLAQGYYLQMPPPRENYLLNPYQTPTEGRY